MTQISRRHNILHAFAGAVDALDDNNENAFRKSMTIVRDAITNYLNEKQQ